MNSPALLLVIRSMAMRATIFCVAMPVMTASMVAQAITHSTAAKATITSGSLTRRAIIVCLAMQATTLLPAARVPISSKAALETTA